MGNEMPRPKEIPDKSPIEEPPLPDFYEPNKDTPEPEPLDRPEPSPVETPEPLPKD